MYSYVLGIGTLVNIKKLLKFSEKYFVYETTK